MSKDTEIAMSDPELDELMAELEAETVAAVAAPAPAPAATVAKKTVTVPSPTKPDETEEAVVLADADLEDVEAEIQQEQAQTEARPPAAPDIPKGTDPVANEKSNFVLPPKMRQPEAAERGDQPPKGRTDIEPATTALKAARTSLHAVPSSPAPAAAEATDPGAMAGGTAPDHNKKPSAAPGLRYGIDVAQFRAETAINPANLDNAMMEQSGLRAYFHEQAALAEAQADRIAASFKVKEAALYDKHRKTLEGVGKVTEKMVENAVLTDPAWLRMKNMVIEAQTIANINRGLVDGLRDRAAMLIQMGSDRRSEQQGQLRIMADQELRDRAIGAARR